MARTRIKAVVINYKTPEFSILAARSILHQLDPERDFITLVDNNSCDGSTEIIAQAIKDNSWPTRVKLFRSPVNGGFSYGNNFPLSDLDAEFYLLVNSDAQLDDGAIDVMLEQARTFPDIGLIGPMAVGENGEHQVSCFNDRTIANEFVRAANTGFLTRFFGLFGVQEVALLPGGGARDVDWISFVAVMIRGEVIRDIGLMDDGYFMYLEDNDYCRRARNKGWRVRYVPHAQVVHANKGWSGRYLERQPRFYYESRTRYFVKYYGRLGWMLANLAWTAGRVVSLLREWSQGRPRCVPIGAWKDIWTWSYGSKPLDYPRPLREQRGK